MYGAIWLVITSVFRQSAMNDSMTLAATTDAHDGVISELIAFIHGFKLGSFVSVYSNRVDQIESVTYSSDLQPK